MADGFLGESPTCGTNAVSCAVWSICWSKSEGSLRNLPKLGSGRNCSGDTSGKSSTGNWGMIVPVNALGKQCTYFSDYIISVCEYFFHSI